MNDGVSSALVQALVSGQSTDAALRELVTQDPRLAPMADLLLRQPAPAEEAEPDEDEDEDEDDDFQVEGETFDEEIAVLRQLVTTMARALGACERCWGSDAACSNCGGDGGPGAFLPDRHLFDEWIAPAIRRLPRRHTRSPTHVARPRPKQGRT